MQAAVSPYPDMHTLTHGLACVFGNNGSKSGPVKVLDREPNVYSSSFASEIVTCQLADGSQRRLFCKYGSSDSQSGYGHRGGLAYEIAVHRDVLQPSRLSSPQFYGAYTDEAARMNWLIVEYVDEGMHVSKSLTAMKLAARWIGRFHAATEARLASDSMTFINTYDAEYYLGWARRTLLFAGQLPQRLSWLAALGARFKEFADLLLTVPVSVIHGEYCVHNILFRDETIYPVDWESAAIAAGEIDLVSLTDDWSEDVVQMCEAEYGQARWPKGAPASFSRTLSAARLYWSLRWLGEAPDWPNCKGLSWRCKQLRAAGEKLGWI